MDLINVAKKQWDRTAAIVLTVLGVIQLITGWVGVSGTNVLAEQAPYIVSGGIAGIFLLALGATLWISADLRDEWRKLDRIEKALADGVLRWAGDGSPKAAGEVDVTADAGSRRRADAKTARNDAEPAHAAATREHA